MSFEAVLAVLTTLPAPAVSIPVGGALACRGRLSNVAACARLPRFSTIAVDHDTRKELYRTGRFYDGIL